MLKIILERLGFEWAEKIYHLSYGMVELPNGKMKSREGTVVDADDLIEEMINTAEAMSKEHGRNDELDASEARKLYTTFYQPGSGTFDLTFTAKNRRVQSLTFNINDPIGDFKKVK